MKRRFFGKDFGMEDDKVITIGDLKPLIIDVIQQTLEEKLEEKIKQHYAKHLEKTVSDDFRWEYNSYSTLSNKGINNNN